MTAGLLLTLVAHPGMLLPNEILDSLVPEDISDEPAQVNTLNQLDGLASCPCCIHQSHRLPSRHVSANITTAGAQKTVR